MNIWHPCPPDTTFETCPRCKPIRAHIALEHARSQELKRTFGRLVTLCRERSADDHSVRSLIAQLVNTYVPVKTPEPGYKKKTIPRSLRKEVFERDLYRCRVCGDHKDLTIDHIIPEVSGGDLALPNLQTLCKICNSQTGATVNGAPP